MSVELDEMPSEAAFRGEDMYTAEQLEGLETLLAMRNPNNIRWKLKVLGREARDPKKGRTISANCWVRLDEYGNPEIIDESKGYNPHKFVCARFCVDGIRIAIGDTAAFARSNGIESLYAGLTDYRVYAGYYNSSAVLEEIDYESQGVILNHPTLWGWNGHEVDNCPLCVQQSEALAKIQSLIDENNAKIEQVTQDNTIYPTFEAGWEYKTMFLPYTKHSERLAGPEGEQVGWWRKYDDMVSVIDQHFHKIRTKRGKPKDVF